MRLKPPQLEQQDPQLAVGSAGSPQKAESTNLLSLALVDQAQSQLGVQLQGRYSPEDIQRIAYAAARYSHQTAPGEVPQGFFLRKDGKTLVIKHADRLTELNVAELAAGKQAEVGGACRPLEAFRLEDRQNKTDAQLHALGYQTMRSVDVKAQEAAAYAQKRFANNLAMFLGGPFVGTPMLLARKSGLNEHQVEEAGMLGMAVLDLGEGGMVTRAARGPRVKFPQADVRKTHGVMPTTQSAGALSSESHAKPVKKVRGEVVPIDKVPEKSVVQAPQIPIKVQVDRREQPSGVIVSERKIQHHDGLKMPSSSVQVGKKTDWMDFDRTITDRGWGALDTRSHEVNRFVSEIEAGYDTFFQRLGKDAEVGKRLRIGGVGVAEKGVNDIDLSPKAAAAVKSWADHTLAELRKLMPNEPLEIETISVGKGWGIDRRDETGVSTPLIHIDNTGTYLHATNTLRGSSTVVYPDSHRPKERFFSKEEAGEMLSPPSGTTVVISGADRQLITKGAVLPTVHSSPARSLNDSADRVTLFLGIRNRDATVGPSRGVVARIDDDFDSLKSQIGRFDRQFPDPWDPKNIDALHRRVQDYLSRYEDRLDDPRRQAVQDMLIRTKDPAH